MNEREQIAAHFRKMAEHNQQVLDKHGHCQTREYNRVIQSDIDAATWFANRLTADIDADAVVLLGEYCRRSAGVGG